MVNKPAELFKNFFNYLQANLAGPRPRPRPSDGDA
jgi:hypothetical protein